MHMAQDSCAHIVARATNCPAGKPTHLTQPTGLPPPACPHHPINQTKPSSRMNGAITPCRRTTPPRLLLPDLPVRFSETPPLPPKAPRNPTQGLFGW